MVPFLKSKELTRSVVRLNSVLDTINQPIWKRDQNLKIIYCNDKYLKIAEIPEGYKEIGELDKNIRKLADKAFNSKTTQTERIKIVSGGQRLDYEVTEVPTETGTIGYARNMEDTVKVEEELQRYKDVQSQLLETSASAIAIYGPDQRLKFFNNSFVTLWKLEESWLGTSPTYGEILEMLREKRRLPEQADFRQFKRDNVEMFNSLINSKEDFYFLPNERSLRVIILPHALGGLQFIYEDMTDRLALERSYNTLLAVQTETLQNLHDGVAVFGESGKLTLSNSVYAKIWALDQKYLGAEPFFSDIMEKTKHLYNWDQAKGDILARTLNRESTEYNLELTNGKVYEVKTAPLPDGEILITYNDITAATLIERTLRERAESLEDVDKLKTEFLQNVSYELRSPLTSIIGFTEILKGSLFGELNPQQKNYLEDIYNSSRQLESLINDILDISTIEAGYMQLNIDRFDVHAMLAHVLSMTQERIKESNLNMQFDCPTTIGKIYGDETRIRQIVFNIVTNSIKFTPSGGWISIIAKNIGDDKISIIVEDTGQGIAKSDIPNVFKKFQKSKTKGGTGLGLSVAKNFVELHGGKIDIESEEGKGTRVIITLPRDSRPKVNPLDQ
jgi:signal transduction histidine kinase